MSAAQAMTGMLQRLWPVPPGLSTGLRNRSWPSRSIAHECEFPAFVLTTLASIPEYELPETQELKPP